MIYRKATVQNVNDQHVTLTTERESTCGQCAMKKGCGTGLMSRHIGNRFNQITLQTSSPLRCGQAVTVAVEEDQLLRAAFLMYLLPLITLFAAALLARMINLNTLSELAAGTMGLLFGLWLVRRISQQQKARFTITLLEEKK